MSIFAVLERINSVLSGIAVPLALCAAGIFLGVKLKFFYILHPIESLKAIKKGGSNGGVSSLGALSLALAGTLGVGNIVGVCSAIALGGFGSVFWIWISALIAMVLKYSEIVLAMKHCSHSSDGTSAGSAMLYIYDYFRSIGHSRLGRGVSLTFSAAFVVCALSMGSMLQAGAVTDALCGVLSLPRAPIALALGLLSLFLSLGGTKLLLKFTGILVPLMSAGYTVMALTVIFMNGSEVSGAFRLILSSALSPRAALAGVGGFAFLRAIRYGVMRGLVSNEAGCGTAPAAHALSSAEPHTQGLWGVLEVAVDTLVLCTLSALVIILEYDSSVARGGTYMMMCVRAFSARLGDAAAYFLCIAVLCFGVATIACWTHYGAVAFDYLFGIGSVRKAFPFIYALCTALGAYMPSELILSLADLSMSVMTLINLSVMTQMSGELLRD